MDRIIVYATQLMETGGIESHILEFCEKMVAAEVEIDLVVSNFQMAAPEEKRLSNTCSRMFIFKSSNRFFRPVWLFCVGIYLNLRRYNAIYTNGQGESIHFFASLLFTTKNWVHHHHMAGDKDDQSTWGREYRQVLRKANVVIACSNKNAEDIEQAVKRPIKVIPCFSREVGQGRRTSKNIERLRFGYYGRLIKEKGIEELCAFSNDDDLNDIEFCVWGEGKHYPPSFFKQYPKLKYNGVFKTKQELEEVIHSIDAFLLLTTHVEGLPICLLEVMSAGKPWLATDRGGIKDIAVDQYATRVIPSDANYAAKKEAVLLLAREIRMGKVSPEKQCALYKERFSSNILVGHWKDALLTNNKE